MKCPNEMSMGSCATLASFTAFIAEAMPSRTSSVSSERFRFPLATVGGRLGRRIGRGHYVIMVSGSGS